MNLLRKILQGNLKYSPKFIKTQKALSSHFVNHRDTPDNNESTPFDFTEDNYKKVSEIMVI